MPHVYDIVTLRQLHNDLLLDEKTMPHVYVDVGRFLGVHTWAVTTLDEITVYT